MHSLNLPRRSLLRLLLAVGATGFVHPARAARPALMLANVYRSGIPLADYLVSEKFDGVRGYWDGSRLVTRGGLPVLPPRWFTAGWPGIPMDGELWAGHGAFRHAVSTVRQQQASDAEWRGMRFMVFDLPDHVGRFDQRLEALRRLLAQADPARLVAVAQSPVGNQAALQARLDAIVSAGGEGLMLHRADAPYRGARSDDLLKFKAFLDSDARVLAVVPGSGKNAGQMGALVVQTPAGQRFKLGTGFSDAQRHDPPPAGSWVVYRFRDLNPGGIPRFASFLRTRDRVEL